MATYTFNESTTWVWISQGTEGAFLNYDVDFGEIYTSGVITREEDGVKWNVIKGESLPQIQLRNRSNKFSIKFDDNKEVILTENAVKQLIKNIKDTRLGKNENAASATKFNTSQEIKLTGDITGSNSSQAGWTINTELKDSTVTPGSYGPNADATPGYGSTFNVPYITVDNKGRITAASTKTVKIPASDNTNYWHTTNSNGWSDNNLTYTASKSNDDIGDLAFTLQKATANSYGVVKIGDNITVSDDGVISVSKISSCIALNNKQLYISKDKNGVGANISEDGKVATYTIDEEHDLDGSTIGKNSVIMVAPVYGDNPNDNLCYSKVADDIGFDEEQTYYTFNDSNKIFEEYTSVTSDTWADDKSKLYTKNDDSKSSSSWQYWENYGIVCIQDETDLNKLKFYLKEAVDFQGIDSETANLPSSIEQRIQIRINIAVFL